MLGEQVLRTVRCICVLLSDVWLLPGVVVVLDLGSFSFLDSHELFFCYLSEREGEEH